MGASTQVCEDFLQKINASSAEMAASALRSAASSSTRAIPASREQNGTQPGTGCGCLWQSNASRDADGLFASRDSDAPAPERERKLIATNDIPRYLEEVL